MMDTRERPPLILVGSMEDSLIYATALWFDGKVVTPDAEFDGLPYAIVIK